MSLFSNRFALAAIVSALIVPAFSQDHETEDVGPQQRQQWFYHQRAFPAKRTPPGARVNALQQSLFMLQQEVAIGLQAATAATSWSLIGPKPTAYPPDWGIVFSPTSGRVSAMAGDPSDNLGNTVYLGGADGGIWKTTDGGTSWSPLTDSQFSLTVGAIAIDPNNHLNVYVGTGEENFSLDSYFGGGLLMSPDGGTTWKQLASSAFGGPGGSYIGGVAIQPGVSTGTPVILVASQYSSGANSSRSGIWRSTDGGTSFSPVFPTSADSNSWATSIVFVSSTTAYAAIGNLFGDATNGVYKSTDAGKTWAAANGSGATAIISGLSAGRITLVAAPSNATTIYASVQSPSTFGLAGIFKSTDGGNTWKAISTPLGTGGGGSTNDFCGGQCWYDMTLAVSPTNPSLIYAGGSYNYGAGNGGLYMSTDGGTSWNTVNPGSNGNGLHPDFHAILFAPNGKLYIGNDGGTWSTANIGTTSVTWKNLNSTLAITEFYPGISVSPTNASLAIDGTQDNGMQIYSGTLQWNTVDTNFCGDGSWAAVDPTNASTLYASCSENGTFATKSIDAGSNWQGIDSTINHGEPAQFVAPLVIDPKNHNTLYVGTDHIWRTTTGADAWSEISPSLSGSSSSFDAVTTIAVSPASASTVFAGTGNGHLWFTTNSGVTWKQVTSGVPARYITMVQGDPKTAGTFYVTYSGFTGVSDTLGHVFKCTTASLACVDISSNLPNIPANDIVIDPDLPKTYYLATDTGIFKTTNGGTSWVTFSTGLPNVVVVGMKLQRTSRTLVAATHGRSVWNRQVPVADLALTGKETPNPVAVGGTLTYTFTVTNNGPNNANTASFSDVVPPGTTFAKASTTVGSCTTPPVGGTGTIACTFGTMAKGAASTVTVALKDTANSGSVIQNTAKVTTQTPDPVSANNSATLKTNVK